MSATAIIRPASAERPLFAPGTAARLWMRVWPLALFNLIAIPAALLRAQADGLGFPVHRSFSGLEEFLFFTWPTHFLQSFFLYHPIEVVASYVYGSWFLLPVAGALPLLTCEPERYWRFIVLLGVTYVACMPFYAVYPLEPPWMHDAQITHVLGAVWPWAPQSDFNQLAPMPSLHVALPVAAALWFGWRQPWGRVVWGYAALISLTVVYSGDHYVADIVAGGLVAWVAYIAMQRCGVIEKSEHQPRVAARLDDPVLKLAA